jgi:hypothetical protein
MYSFIVLAAALSGAVGAEKPMTAETVVEKMVEGKATVEFAVAKATLFRTSRSLPGGESEALCLNGKPGKGGGLFYVILSRETATRLLRLGIDDVEAHFRGKVVRVAGTIVRREVGKRSDYHIEVTDLDQIEMVRKP